MGMVKKIILVFLILILGACGNPPAPDTNPVVEVGYQPPVIPVRVSINTRGEVDIELSGGIVTPIGTFDISGSTTVTSLRGQYEQKVLIIRVDGEATVYLLEDGKEFHVTFDDNNTLYKKVAFRHETNGDIILELESVKISAIDPPPSDNPVAGQQTHASAEDGLRNYYNAISSGNYKKAWGLLTDNFKSTYNSSGYGPYADWWSTVSSVDVRSVNVYSDNGQSANLQANIVYYYNNGQTDANDVMEFYMLYDSYSNEWLIDDAALR